jgi:hypothetical protein
VVHRGGPSVNLDPASVSIVLTALWTVYILIPHSLFPRLQTFSLSGTRHISPSTSPTHAVMDPTPSETAILKADSGLNSWTGGNVVSSTIFRAVIAVVLFQFISSESFPRMRTPWLKQGSHHLITNVAVALVVGTFIHTFLLPYSIPQTRSSFIDGLYLALFYGWVVTIGCILFSLPIEMLMLLMQSNGASPTIIVSLGYLLMSTDFAFVLYSLLPFVSASWFGEHSLILLYPDQNLLSICYHGLTVVIAATMQAMHFHGFLDT